jgi:hypothetical protein
VLGGIASGERNDVTVNGVACLCLSSRFVEAFRWRAGLCMLCAHLRTLWCRCVRRSPLRSRLLAIEGENDGGRDKEGFVCCFVRVEGGAEAGIHSNVNSQMCVARDL